MNHNAARVELGDFLRKRRASLTPDAVGLPVYGRRRAPGLRREEVAGLAGVSTVWYTWLEQGRDVRPSYATIGRIAAVLRLRSDEQSYLTSLLDRRFPPERPLTADELAPIRLLVNGVTNYSAFARNSLWELLCWNERYQDTFGNWVRSAPNNNLLHALFLNDHLRARIDNRKEAAEQAVERFRIDYGQHAHDLRYRELIENLKRDSAEFSSLWERHRVKGVSNKPIELILPEHGSIKFDRISLHPAGFDDVTVVIHFPLG